jgi:hypothetical protein
MNNKLDTFNKDKRKCLKCKEYFDKRHKKSFPLVLCDDCVKKWHQFLDNSPPIRTHNDFNYLDDWYNNEQT